MSTWTPPTSEPYQPQASLERALVTILQTSTVADPPGLGWSSRECGRTFDGRPPPNIGGEWYASVWHDGSRQAGPNARTCLDEYHSVFITITVRTPRVPFDRWVIYLRDQLEDLANRVRALIGKDTDAFRLSNAGNALADFRNSGVPDGVNRVGFCESLVWQGDDMIQEVGPEWFHASLDETDITGLAQRLRFGGARRIQAWATSGY